MSLKTSVTGAVGAVVCGENNVVASSLENYGVKVAEVARQVEISTFVLSNILTRTLANQSRALYPLFEDNELADRMPCSAQR